jgi:hypothetical protein
MYVDGVWGPSESSARLDAWSPVTGAKIGTVPDGTRSDVRRAIAADDAASHASSRASAFERARLMERIAEVVAERRDSLGYVLTLDQGKPLASEAYAEGDEFVTYFRMAAADVRALEGTVPPSADSRTPPRFLEAGDTLETEIDCLGNLLNPCAGRPDAQDQSVEGNLKIVVPIKPVGRLVDDFELPDEHNDVAPDFIEWELNEWDAFSVEVALQPCIQVEPKVTAFTVGGEEARDGLRTWLAIGVGRAEDQ